MCITTTGQQRCWKIQNVYTALFRHKMGLGFRNDWWDFWTLTLASWLTLTSTPFPAPSWFEKCSIRKWYGWFHYLYHYLFVLLNRKQRGWGGHIFKSKIWITLQLEHLSDLLCFSLPVVFTLFMIWVRRGRILGNIYANSLPLVLTLTIATQNPHPQLKQFKANKHESIPQHKKRPFGPQAPIVAH